MNINEKTNDKTITECLNHSNRCTSYIDSLLKSIKSEFIKGSIDRYAYERQINLLTVIKLEIEHIQAVSKESIINQLGVFIDAKA